MSVTNGSGKKAVFMGLMAVAAVCLLVVVVHQDDAASMQHNLQLAQEEIVPESSEIEVSEDKIITQLPSKHAIKRETKKVQAAKKALKKVEKKATHIFNKAQGSGAFSSSINPVGKIYEVRNKMVTGSKHAMKRAKRKVKAEKKLLKKVEQKSLKAENKSLKALKKPHKHPHKHMKKAAGSRGHINHKVAKKARKAFKKAHKAQKKAKKATKKATKKAKAKAVIRKARKAVRKAKKKFPWIPIGCNMGMNSATWMKNNPTSNIGVSYINADSTGRANNRYAPVCKKPAE